MDIEKALEKVRQFEANNPIQEPPTSNCRGCGKKLLRGANSLDGLCVGGGTYPASSDLSEDCSSHFTTWLLAHEDLGPKVLACALPSDERSIAIDEWLMSK